MIECQSNQPPAGMGNRQTHLADAFAKEQNNKQGYPGEPQEKDERPDKLDIFHGLRKKPADDRIPISSLRARRLDGVDSAKPLSGQGFKVRCPTAAKGGHSPEASPDEGENQA